MVDRSQAFLYKAGQLGLVGLTSGALGVALTKLVGGGQEEDPKSATSAHGWRGPIMGLGLQMAISSHLRYQGIAGVDRWLGQRCSHLGMVLGGTTALRVTNAAVGEVSRARTSSPSGRAERARRRGGGGGRRRREGSRPC